MYKQASRFGLRVITSRGALSVEQLWDLNVSQLATVIKGAKKELNQTSDSELSFLDENAAQVDPVVQLRFDILKDIYLTKSGEAKAALLKKDQKAELQTLLAIKAKRAEDAKEKMSDEDLEKAITALNK